MSRRYFLDEDISYRVAIGLRARGVDAVSVHRIGRANQGISDADQLELAVDQGRVLVTYNRQDYQVLDIAWRTQGHGHRGIWCVSERSIPNHDISGPMWALIAVAEQFDALDGLCLPLPRAQEA